MKKKLLMGFIAVVLLCLLSGCVKGDFHVTVNADSSADLEYKLGMNGALAGLMSAGKDAQEPIQQIKQGFEKQGFTVTQYREGEYVGVIAKKHQNNVNELTSVGPMNDINASFAKGDNSMKVDVQKGLLYNTYSYKGVMDLGSMKPDTNDAMGIQKALLSQIDLKFTLTLPIAAEEQNATRLLGDQKTYQWDLVPGSKNEIILKAKVFNVTNVIIIVVIFVVVLLMIAFAMLRKRKRPLRYQEALPLEEQNPNHLD
ncbi:LppM family (lipo)protein [Paenibacillus thalictri]|uniref:DUF3153 domain-containing protein n=1 Tax=Paenibacillus thalictri TaxID=2527873 RepID=A0A4Q9DYA0_9BACL|nr:DUF3153 domain-containing protein [Paenibacillus thalictri]TBL80828.1 DUF3153 domain-containing protein [Paenibacillus thalictri]